MNNLQLVSLEARKEKLENQKVKVFRIPPSLKKFMERYYSSTKTALNINTIRKAIMIDFPDEVLWVLSSLNDIKANNDIWIIGIESIDIDLLKITVLKCLKKEYEDKFKEAFSEDFGEHWGSFEEYTLSELYDYTLMYTLLAKYYAYRCSNTPIYMKCLGRELIFHRIISEAKETIIVSEPIDLNKEKRKGKNKIEPFSYYLSFSVVKPIDMDCYCINFSLHTRLWEVAPYISEDNSFNYISSKQNTNLYIYKEGKFKATNQRTYQQISIKRKDNSYMITNNADRYLVEKERINLDQILYQNKAIRTFNNGYALITSKKKNTIFKRGAGLPERKEIQLEIIRFCSELTLRIELNRIQNKFNRYKKPLTYKGSKKYICLTIVLDNIYIREIIKKKIQEILQLTEFRDRFEYFDTVIEVRFISESFCKELDNEEIKLNCEKQMIEAFNDISNKDILNLAFINLPNYKIRAREYDEKKDPKQFIRNTLIKMEIITQFIDFGEYLDKTLSELSTDKALIAKIENGLKDLLATGEFFHKEVFEDKVLFSNDIDCILAIGKVHDQQNNTIIAATMIDKNGVKVKYYNSESKENWRELNQIYTYTTTELLNKIKIKSKNNKQVISSNISEWIKDTLSELLKTYNKIIFLTECALRNHCVDFKNETFKKIQKNYHIVGNDRVIFIRINNLEEVPDYNIITDKETLNRNSGLYGLSDNSNTFYYIPQRSNTEQTPLGATKIDYPERRITKQRAIEISIRCKEEKKKDYAIIVVNAMKAPLTAQPNTTMPLPLYLLKQISNYIYAEYQVTRKIKDNVNIDEMLEEELLRNE